MNLGFTQQIKGKPTHFVAKIWKSFLYGIEVNAHDFVKKFDLISEENKTLVDAVKPKKHTIRSGNRWRAGMKIHFCIGLRTKNYFQFAPVVECKSVQTIEIKWYESKEVQDISNGCVYNLDQNLFAYIKLDGKQLSHRQMQIIAINDGFKSVDDFFEYFNKDFTGQLVHWTDQKY